MSRVIADLHPKLQDLIIKLQLECNKKGIKIVIGECLRTVVEQDNLYAQGRTTSGMKVTNAKGSTFSSMHQWGIAFDFYLDIDVDKDGNRKDDAFNNNTGLFEKVGAIGQSIGLEWGGAWKSIKDRPHFQLPDWGSTPSKLKSLYGTPDKFKADWIVKPVRTVTKDSAKGEIKWLQTNLNKCITSLKFNTLKVDGDYGKCTINAVLLYWEQLGWNKDKEDDGTRSGAKTLFALETGKIN